MNRWPAVMLIVLMLGGLVALDQRSVDDVDATHSAVERSPSESDASGSTWYCPAGFTTPDGSNDHTVIITNPTDTATIGTVTVYPSLVDVNGDPVPFPRAAQPVEVPAQSQLEVSLAPVVASLDVDLATNTGAFVAALAEFDQSGVIVDHQVVAAQGTDLGPCASSASTRWWFASGTTTADVSYQLYLLNPFPDDAVVDISFVTDAGSRSPSVFNGKLVPAQSLTVLQVSPEVPVNAQMTAQVSVLTGRVIAERIQIFGNEAGPAGLSMSLGADRLADQWFFPAGRSIPGAAESYVIYNPGEEAAEVEFELKPDSADRVGDIAPRLVPVGPRERWIVTVTSQPSHPVDALASIDATAMASPSERFFASIRSFNGVPIAAERIVTRPAGQGGVTATFGNDEAATEHFVNISSTILEADAATLAVLNPAGDTIARVQVMFGGPSGERLVTEVELAPRRRAVLPLDELVGADDHWIHLISSTGTIAEVTILDGTTVMSTTATAVEGTTSTPDLLAFE